MSYPSADGKGDSVQAHATRDADRLIDRAKGEASDLADSARQVGRQQAQKRFEDGKQIAGEQVDAVQHALDDAARRLREDDSPFASYAGELSGQLSSLSSRIESSSIDELIRDGRRVARDNPGLFTLGAVALGFAAARFLKASDRRDDDEYIDGPDREAFEDGYRSAQSVHRRPHSARRAAPPYRRNATDSTPRVPLESPDPSSQAATPQMTSPRVNLPVGDLNSTSTGSEH